ncbi:MAG: response regulator [Myxococcales bacterium]|nr:response regulator [Myxococcales bacterium]
MGRKVLLIEDEPEIQLLVKVGLEPFGYTVVIAEDGDKGLATALADDIDAVLIDLMVPRMHGYEVIQRLRADSRTRSLPVIVISAKTFASDQRKALDLGADAFVQKPFEPQEVHELLTSLFWRTRVTFWGVRGSIAAPGPETVRYGGNTPCVTIEHGEHMLILDAGTGLRRLGIDLARRGLAHEMHMLISHTHWDHIQGFPFFVPAYAAGNKLRIYGPRTIDKPLDRVLRGQMDPEYFPVALGDMEADIEVTELRGDPIDIGPFHITYAYMNHPGVTLGYRIEVGGRVITYATDTEPYRYLLKQQRPDQDGEEYGRKRDEHLVALAQDADLYIADSQYAPKDYETKLGWGHTCYLDAVDVGVDAGVKCLALFSHDPMHDDAAIDDKLEQSQARVQERGAEVKVVAATEGAHIIVE